MPHVRVVLRVRSIEINISTFILYSDRQMLLPSAGATEPLLAYVQIGSKLHLHAAYDPLHFVLFHPYSDLGWCVGLKLRLDVPCLLARRVTVLVDEDSMPEGDANEASECSPEDVITYSAHVLGQFPLVLLSNIFPLWKTTAKM